MRRRKTFHKYRFLRNKFKVIYQKNILPFKDILSFISQKLAFFQSTGTFIIVGFRESLRNTMSFELAGPLFRSRYSRASLFFSCRSFIIQQQRGTSTWIHREWCDSSETRKNCAPFSQVTTRLFLFGAWTKRIHCAQFGYGTLFRVYNMHPF